MTELRALYTLWLREVKRYLRDRTRIVSSFFQPLLWLVVFGTGIGATLRGGFQIAGVSYQQLIFPGIIAQTLLFTSMFMGISVIWDRDFGFLKEILVAPISRFSLFIGKMLGDSTDAIIQGIIVFAIAIPLGINFGVTEFLVCLPLMFLITIGLVSVGLVIASFMGSLESFGAIQSFINLPLFFLSGALFPVVGSNIEWLEIAARLNPLTYGVDALKTIILGSAYSPLQIQPLFVDIAIVGIFDLVMMTIGTLAFSRMK
ncbi:MAG TPA: ABC transporter permease [Candidatus Sulfotelmatobacter sp.]|jgi:ABC-2 type transport system permease protein|nr:ABC transporter permease [Candidatus Sulfotelmatobacter sp.]